MCSDSLTLVTGPPRWESSWCQLPPHTARLAILQYSWPQIYWLIIKWVFFHVWPSIVAEIIAMRVVPSCIMERQLRIRNPKTRQTFKQEGGYVAMYLLRPRNRSPPKWWVKNLNVLQKASFLIKFLYFVVSQFFFSWDSGKFDYKFSHRIFWIVPLPKTPISLTHTAVQARSKQMILSILYSISWLIINYTPCYMCSQFHFNLLYKVV